MVNCLLIVGQMFYTDYHHASRYRRKGRILNAFRERDRSAYSRSAAEADRVRTAGKPQLRACFTEMVDGTG
jgi:hypothetical protein